MSDNIPYFSQELDGLKLIHGDVLIVLGSSRSDHLLLHRDFLQQFPYFQPGFRWPDHAKVRTSTDANAPAMWVYGLTLTSDLDDWYDFFILTAHPDPRALDKFGSASVSDDKSEDSKRSWSPCICPMSPADNPIPLHRFGYPFCMRDGACQSLTTEELYRLAVMAHQLLFRILYEQEPDGELFDLSVEERALLLAEVVAYADHYLLLDYIFPVIKRLFEEPAYMGKDVAENPLFYLAIGERIHSHALATEAVMHLVGSRTGIVDSFRWHNELQRRTELSRFELEVALFVYKQREELQRHINEARTSLQSAALTETRMRIHSSGKYKWKQIKTIFLFSRSEHRSSKEKIEFLASSIFSQWLVRRLGGWSTRAGNIYHLDFVARLDVNDSLLYRTLKTLHEAGQGDDTNLFGEDAPRRLAKWFLPYEHSQLPETEQRLRDKLAGLLHHSEKYWNYLNKARYVPPTCPYFTIEVGDLPWMFECPVHGKAYRQSPFRDPPDWDVPQKVFDIWFGEGQQGTVDSGEDTAVDDDRKSVASSLSARCVKSWEAPDE